MNTLCILFAKDNVQFNETIKGLNKKLNSLREAYERNDFEISRMKT